MLDFIKLVAPLAPFIAEEMYSQLEVLGLKLKDSVHMESWPKCKAEYLQKQETNLVAQVNGKLRAEFKWPTDQLEDKEAIIEHVKALDGVKKWLDGAEIKKEIYVPGKIVNLVI